jgi:hypothetical protein
MKTTHLRSLTAASFVGLLSLTGCAAGTDNAAFCDFTTTIDAQFDAVNASPTDEAFVAAQSGDTTGLNAWGEESSAQLQTLVDSINGAKSGAPDKEAEQALDLMERATTTVKEVSELAATTDDFDGFLAEAEEKYATLEEEISTEGDPEATLAAKTEEHCETP